MNKWVNEYESEAIVYFIQKQCCVITFHYISVRFSFTQKIGNI